MEFLDLLVVGSREHFSEHRDDAEFVGHGAGQVR